MDSATDDPLNETLWLGHRESKLGLVLVALSGRGVAAILLGNDPLALRRELAATYPENRLAEDADRLAETVTKVVAFVNNPDRTRPQHGDAGTGARANPEDRD